MRASLGVWVGLCWVDFAEFPFPPRRPTRSSFGQARLRGRRRYRCRWMRKGSSGYVVLLSSATRVSVCCRADRNFLPPRPPLLTSRPFVHPSTHPLIFFRSHPHQWARRRNGCLAMDRYQVRRSTLGARSRRSPPDARPQQPPRPSDSPDRRSDSNGTRRRHCLCSRCRGVWFCDDSAHVSLLSASPVVRIPRTDKSDSLCLQQCSRMHYDEE